MSTSPGVCLPESSTLIAAGLQYQKNTVAILLSTAYDHPLIPLFHLLYSFTCIISYMSKHQTHTQALLMTKIGKGAELYRLYIYTGFDIYLTTPLPQHHHVARQTLTKRPGNASGRNGPTVQLGILNPKPAVVAAARKGDRVGNSHLPHYSCHGRYLFD